MRTIFILLIFSLSFISIGHTKKINQEHYSAAPIVSASLFKNGLALVDRQVEVPPHTNTIIIKDNPRPIHGTFWTNFNEDVDFIFTRLNIIDEKPKSIDIRQLFRHIAGEKVTLYLKDNMSVQGQVTGSAAPDASLITLQTEDGIEFIDPQKVWRFTVHKKDVRITHQQYKEVLAIKIKVKPSGKKRSFRFSYVTHGLTWAPSYRLNLLKKKKDQATLAFKAVLKNELGDLHNCDINLVSGFPAITFQNVVSPLSLDVTVNSFFSQLANRNNGPRYRREIVTQNVAMTPAYRTNSPAGIDQSELSTSDFDIHLQNIGPVTLLKGQTRLVSIDRKKITIERVVEWNIKNTRDRYGRYVRAGDVSSEKVWDALIIKNPFTFPMTTAPISFYRNDQFFSQNISYWISPNRKNTVKFTKALNIGVRQHEEEVAGKRKKVYIMGDSHRKSIINGSIMVTNRRNRQITMIIKRDFQGKLISADKKPEKSLLPGGAYSVNEHSQLTWTLRLKPGEKLKLKYSYSVLVDI